jgi:tetratricopeptide (TPR) repeat protein
MSLLLEALKKAEKAKEDAQRRAKGADAGAPAQPSAFDPESTVLDDGRHITTRDELPAASTPLEILADELRPPAKAATMELRLADEQPVQEPKMAPRREPARTRAAAGAQNSPSAQNGAAGAERATAQRVFEAKFKEPNPRLPFFITMGALGAFGVGTVFYFWLQLRPAPPLVNTNPQRAADEKPVDTAALKPAVLPSTPGSPPSATTTANIPGLPGSVPATPPPATAPSPAAPAVPPAAAPATAPAAQPAPAPASPVVSIQPSAAAATANRAGTAPRIPTGIRAPKEDGPVTVSQRGPQIHPLVASGYAAYLAGDLPKAREDYQQVLREEPRNRDALLGLAGVEMRAQRYDLANGHYQRVLQIDPRDAHAQAGIVALRGQQLDPVQVESRMKSLIAADREANILYFTLGNQYAQQGRWAEAQRAYFKAYSADPENPDFAFNVAVSLDQLHQPKLALEYYQRALNLAQNRSASFDAEAARTRAQQLSR